MIGTSERSSLTRRCNSMPSIPGIRTSVITKAAAVSVPDCRNSSADENTAGSYPADSIRLSNDSRTRKSSSMAATICVAASSMMKGNSRYAPMLAARSRADNYRFI